MKSSQFIILCLVISCLVLLATCAPSHKKHQKRMAKKHSKIQRRSAQENDEEQENSSAQGDKRDMTSEAGKMEGRIRNKGTFTLSYVDVNADKHAAAEAAATGDAPTEEAATTQRLSKKHKSKKKRLENEEEPSNTESSINNLNAVSESEVSQPTVQPPKPQKKYFTAPSSVPEVAEGQQAPTPHKLFDSEKIELPILCKSELTEAEQTAIAHQAVKFVGQWQTAGSDVGGLYNAMPFLDATQFADYYAEIVANVTVSENEMSGEDAKGNAENLLKKVCFDQPRTQIGWLEFWVYMCNKGVKPEDSAWLGQEMSDQEILQQQVNSMMQAKAEEQKARKEAEAQKAIEAAEEASDKAIDQQQAAEAAETERKRNKKRARKVVRNRHRRNL